MIAKRGSFRSIDFTGRVSGSRFGKKNMTNNAKIAAYFNIPYCEHDWSGSVTITGVATTDITELSTCIHCGAYEDGDWDDPIDFATESGFFVLLDALRAKGYRVELSVPASHYMLTKPRVTIESADTDSLRAYGDNSQTALVAATLEFIQKEQTK